MKSIVTENGSNKHELTFPVLMKSKDNGIVVLFVGNTNGICLSGRGEITYKSEPGWLPANGENWEPFTGTITLSND